MRLVRRIDNQALTRTRRQGVLCVAFDCRNSAARPRAQSAITAIRYTRFKNRRAPFAHPFVVQPNWATTPPVVQSRFELVRKPRQKRNLSLCRQAAAVPRSFGFPRPCRAVVTVGYLNSTIGANRIELSGQRNEGRRLQHSPLIFPSMTPSNGACRQTWASF